MKSQLLGNLKQGLLIAISAPAGTGKTTLVRKLIAELPQYVVQSISCTTRALRPGEVDGKDYFFLTKDEFARRKNNGEFIETVSVFSADYGTLSATIANQRQGGKHVICVVDTYGALALKEKENARLIFLLPPSLATLKERLKKRKTESKEGLEERLERVHFELDQIKHFDYQVVNCDLEIASQVLKSILIAEEHRLEPYT
ncbi:MAG: guanylate kinase [Chlamydiota bacterium]